MDIFLRTGALALLLACFLNACEGSGKKSVSTKQHSDAALINARLGTEYLRKNMLDQARFKLERALEQDNKIALAHSSYAVLMARIGKKKLARKHFKQALRLDEEDADTLNNFGLFLCDDGDTDKAMEYFRRAYSDPFYKTPEIALANAGVCLSGSERASEGVDYVKRAIAINSDYADGYRQLAFLYHKMGNSAQAKRAIDNFHERFGYTISSLQLGIQIARQNRDRKQAAEYLGIMGRKFSNSQEYRQAIDDLRDNPIK